MQLTRQDIQIVEREVTTENGLFLARFAVTNVGGVLKAKLISMVSLEAPVAISNTTLLLENPRDLQKVTFIEPEAKEIVSPYSALVFLSSISPRAPNTK
jgi:hypothetical protein